MSTPSLRRLALRLVAAALLLLWLGCASQPPDRPNIVVPFADDLGYGSVSCYRRALPTPNIDSLPTAGSG